MLSSKQCLAKADAKKKSVGSFCRRDAGTETAAHFLPGDQGRSKVPNTSSMMRSEVFFLFRQQTEIAELHVTVKSCNPTFKGSL